MIPGATSAPMEARRLCDRLNHASSRAIGMGAAVLIVGPELCSRARWDDVKTIDAKRGCASSSAPVISWAYLRTPASSKHTGSYFTPGSASACLLRWARLARVVRVSGWSRAETRSRTGGSAACWSRAPAASTACPARQGLQATHPDGSCHPAARGGDIHIAADRNRMISRRHHPGLTGAWIGPQQRRRRHLEVRLLQRTLDT